ncbi:hypothetical protein [Succinivibrio sp.]|uniref:hypothetical protein n=1 Tax=Succinivibrio sp. TaxID=2053619 RepID=UPI0025D45548|nr:hypothetical protein [Succinivibrio sp.]MBQ9219646.1 hypothetical protein [Succinivibrio sp.]
MQYIIKCINSKTGVTFYAGEPYHPENPKRATCDSDEKKAFKFDSIEEAKALVPFLKNFNESVEIKEV